jgi:dipeptidyl-peptidase-4
MKKISILFIAIFLSVSARAQHQQYTMEEATLGLKGSLAPENIKQLGWIPNQDAFTRLSADKHDPALLYVSVPKMNVDTLMTLSRLNQHLFGRDSLKNIPPIQWIDADNFCFNFNQVMYAGNKEQGIWTFKKWAALPKNAANITVDKNHKQIAYTLGNNLYLLDYYGKTMAVTENTNPGIVSGQIVSRNEFGIDGGIFFSPKGNFLAYYKLDESRVDDYPIIDWATTPATNRNIKYPMAGRTSQEVQLLVFNPITRKSVLIQTGLHTDHYLTSVTWSPDEQSIYLAILNRDQNHLALNQYNAKTGAFVKTLFTESDPKYVHPMHNLYFLPKGNEFIWWSERDGFMHLYRYNTQGKLLNQVTRGAWVVNDINGIHAAQKELIIATSKESPLSKDVYTVNWENGKMRRIDQADGMHEALVNDAGTYWIDRYSNAQTPRVINVSSVSGSWNKNLLTAADPLKNFDRPQIKEVKLQANDGTPLYGRLIYPVSFNPNKKYPVIVYLYNGPGVQLLHHSFPESENLWYEYLAQHGYVVFTMDGRGSANRGLRFEQATFRHLGTLEMEDQLKGVDYLKSLPFVDAGRMGVHGWSFGGFMTTSLMLRHPGIFKCAVAGGPVIDWSMYEVMYTERYMDRPEQNPEGYAESNLLTKVDHLQGKLLLIHGASDSTVVWQHSMKFLKACVDKGVQVDYFVYPGHPHNVRGKDRVHLMQKITDYFDEYLK